MTPLPQISVSVKAAIVHQDRILLMSYEDHSGFHYNLPGGKAREGESLRDAVTRKVLDETGLSVRAVRELFVVEYQPGFYNGEFGDVHKTQHNFLAELVDNGSSTPRASEPPDPDQVGFEWTPLSELSNRYLLPRITDHLLAAIADPTGRDVLVDRW